MPFDLISLQPKASNWFSPTVEYDGYGTASFKGPEGSATGPVRIELDRFGRLTARITVENFISDTARHLLELLGEGNNICKALTVETKDGLFEMEGDAYYSYSVGTEESSVTFSPMLSHLRRKGSKTPVYWVLPLFNFLSEFLDQDKSLNSHALRIYPTPHLDLPPDLPEAQALQANLLAHSRNRLIIFDFDGRLGFIEPLKDFEDLKKDLVQGNSPSSVTAVMVGEMKDLPFSSFDELDGWFPYDLLLLLGLATGTETGAPFVEFRDVDGQLVQRSHAMIGTHRFSRGNITIKEGFDRGIGKLLTKAQSSDAYGKAFLKVAIQNLIRSGRNDSTIEDKMRSLLLTYENLCEAHKITGKLTLDEERGKAVNQAIDDAISVVARLSREARGVNELVQAQRLDRVAQKLSQSKSIETNFGQDVVSLIERFGFPDVEILSKYYEQNPRNDGRKWHELVPYIRGKLMHRSYFDFKERKELLDIVVVMNHLHDIMTRTILTILNYDGTYQPTVLKFTSPQPVNWVTLDTSPMRLGYPPEI